MNKPRLHDGTATINDTRKWYVPKFQITVEIWKKIKINQNKDKQGLL